MLDDLTNRYQEVTLGQVLRSQLGGLI